MKNLFVEKYQEDTIGVIKAFDREIFSGSLIPLTYVDGLKRFLRANSILLKDFKNYAMSLSEELKSKAKNLAESNNAPYIYFNDSKHRNEKEVKQIINQRGEHPGLVAIITKLEIDNSYELRLNKETNKLELKQRKRRSLHIYYYFIDEDYGLCFFRVQSYFPFKVKVYINGHEKLAVDMKKAKIKYSKDDNCFTWIENIEKAQRISDRIDVRKFHSKLDSWVEQYVPIINELSKVWKLKYRWSIKQIEYSTDIIFKSEKRLNILFEQLLNNINNTVLPENVMSFLGKKLSGKQSGRIQSNCRKTYNGFRIKHQSGALSIKLYNKAGNVLRVEVTINNLHEFKVIRDVHHRGGSISKEKAVLEKSIYSLIHVVRIGNDVTRRYLDFIANIEDNSRGISELSEFTNRKTEGNKNYKGFNPLNEFEYRIFQALGSGALIAGGFRNKHLKKYLKTYFHQQWTTSKVSRLLKRLIIFKLIKRVKNSYKYYLTEKGRIIVTMFLKLRNLTVVPALTELLDNKLYNNLKIS